MVRRLITAIWAWLRGERRQTKRADAPAWAEMPLETAVELYCPKPAYLVSFDPATYDKVAAQIRADAEADFDAQLALDVPFVSEDSGTMRLQTADVRFPKPSYLIEYKAPLDVERRNQQLERDVVDWMRKSCACETCAAKRRGLS